MCSVTHSLPRASGSIVSVPLVVASSDTYPPSIDLQPLALITFPCLGPAKKKNEESGTQKKKIEADLITPSPFPVFHHPSMRTWSETLSPSPLNRLLSPPFFPASSTIDPSPPSSWRRKKKKKWGRRSSKLHRICFPFFFFLYWYTHIYIYIIFN